MILMRDQNFFFDCAVNDLTPQQVTKVILRQMWPESDKEIYEHDLQEQRRAKNRTNKQN